MTCKRSQSLPNLGQHTTFSTPGGTDSLSNPWIHGKRRLWEERAIYFHGELSAVAPTPIGFAITGPHHKQVSLGRDLFPFFSEIQVGISLIIHLLNTMLFEKKIESTTCSINIRPTPWRQVVPSTHWSPTSLESFSCLAMWCDLEKLIVGCFGCFGCGIY